MTSPFTVQQSVTVHAPIERAFRTFTERFDDFKPREHNLMESPIVESVFEGAVGGFVYDRAEDGTICRWARVLAFEPPHRLVFSWDIGPTWQLESDPAKCSEVEVRFVAESPTVTRVELEHRHLERHGDRWRSLAGDVAGGDGWPVYLQRFAELVDAEN